MKKKMVTVLIALLLIIIIGAVYGVKIWVERYSYSKEMADMEAYYQVSGNENAIILQDEMIAEKAILQDGYYYLDLATVHKYFNEIFYVDYEEKLLLYTTPTDVIRVNFGENSYTTAQGTQTMDCVIVYAEGDSTYIAMDYVKLFTNFSYECFDRHIQVYTQWGDKEMAETNKLTWVRERGGVKSPILREVAQGETVEILERMDKWSKVKTADSIIGYIENKRLGSTSTVAEVPVTDYQEPEYTSLSMEGKVSLGFHSIGGVAGNGTLESMVSGTKGMNVIAPTWFSLNDNEGNFRSFASSEYVSLAHGMGLKVWGVLDDFNYSSETGAEVEVYNVLSSTARRQKLVKGIADTAVSLGLDGINIDFEKVGVDCGRHYVQFLRELSIQCRVNGLVLSVDNFVPFNFNEYYRLDIQGEIVDYVIMMGYDEHWHGSGNPGSVASIGYVTDGLAKMVEKVPAQKVINALPFYTILWKSDGANVTDEYLTVSKTNDFMSQVNAEIVWDETACQNYAEWTEGSATYQVWLEDAESISVKLNVMNAQNIAGVAVWRLGYGNSEVWELLNAYTNS